VTAERRLARVETSLSPTQLVLRWLEEAHAFGDLEFYVRALLTEDAVEGPLDRLARQAEHGVRMRLRGTRPEVVTKAVRSALRETFFRFELVTRINVTALELLDREVLIDAALAAQIGLLASEGRTARRRDAMHQERFGTLRGLLLFRMSELRAAQEARAAVEGRYLAGHAALFPAAATSWEEQLTRSETLADLAVRLAEMDGVPSAEPVDPDAVSARVTELIADLVEPAKASALEMLGEGERAHRIASAWLRSKLAAPIASRLQIGQ
jgi:hypothetical protein